MIVRGVFLDISRAFDKVWHDGLVFKLKSYGVEGEILSLLKNYLQNREQRVVLNGQTSKWRKINSGIPQGSLLRPGQMHPTSHPTFWFECWMNVG